MVIIINNQVRWKDAGRSMRDVYQIKCKYHKKYIWYGMFNNMAFLAKLLEFKREEFGVFWHPGNII